MLRVARVRRSRNEQKGDLKVLIAELATVEEKLKTVNRLRDEQVPPRGLHVASRHGRRAPRARRACSIVEQMRRLGAAIHGGCSLALREELLSTSAATSRPFPRSSCATRPKLRTAL